MQYDNENLSELMYIKLCYLLFRFYNYNEQIEMFNMLIDKKTDITTFKQKFNDIKIRNKK